MNDTGIPTVMAMRAEFQRPNSNDEAMVAAGD
jgi:hypothetical protein